MRFAEPNLFPEPRRRRGPVLFTITVVAVIAMPAAVIPWMPERGHSSQQTPLRVANEQASKAFPDERVTVAQAPRPIDVTPDLDGRAVEASEAPQTQVPVHLDQVLASVATPEHERARGPMGNKARSHHAHADALIKRRPHFRGKKRMARTAPTEGATTTASAASTEFASW